MTNSLECGGQAALSEVRLIAIQMPLQFNDFLTAPSFCDVRVE